MVDESGATGVALVEEAREGGAVDAEGPATPGWESCGDWPSRAEDPEMIRGGYETAFTPKPDVEIES